MRRTFSLRRFLVALCATTAVLCQADGTLAQVGVLNPNPTMPSGSSLGAGAYGRPGGIGIGRGPVPPGQAREENPAETLLKSLEGTNYGHHSGHVLAPPVETSVRSLPPRTDQSPAEAPRWTRRMASAAISPVGGRPENRWRYRLSQGRWWYLMDGGRWSYFNGNRWVPYPHGRHGVSSARNARASQERQ